MVTNLRIKAEQDLARTLEGEFKVPVVLITPDGETIDTSENDGLPLGGQVLSDSVTIDPETGEPIVVFDPIVVLRRSSLSRVPIPGETWFVKIPINPNDNTTLEDFVIDSDRSPEGGRSIGFIRLYLRRVAQS